MAFSVDGLVTSADEIERLVDERLEEKQQLIQAAADDARGPRTGVLGALSPQHLSEEADVLAPAMVAAGRGALQELGPAEEGVAYRVDLHGLVDPDNGLSTVVVQIRAQRQ